MAPSVFCFRSPLYTLRALGGQINSVWFCELSAHFLLFSYWVLCTLRSEPPAWLHPKGGVPESFPALRKFWGLLQFRFMHAYVFHSLLFPWLSFWLQTELVLVKYQNYILVLRYRTKLFASTKLACVFRLFPCWVSYLLFAWGPDVLPPVDS